RGVDGLETDREHPARLVEEAPDLARARDAHVDARPEVRTPFGGCLGRHLPFLLLAFAEHPLEGESLRQPRALLAALPGLVPGLPFVLLRLALQDADVALVLVGGTGRALHLLGLLGRHPGGRPRLRLAVLAVLAVALPVAGAVWFPAGDLAAALAQD